MTNKTYILCPGQGAQQVGMGRDYFERFDVARATFERANEVIGFDLSSICFGGPEERLNKTDVSQPAIYVTGVACWRAAEQAGTVDPKSVAAWAGLSLGEYTALHLAGVVSFEEGLRLVAARGRYMQEAAVALPSGMVAIAGGDEAQVTELCGQAAEGEVLVPANFNAPGQIVVSGAARACERVVKVAEGAGLKAIPLKVAGAFHSPLMQTAADRMAGELSRVQFNPPTAPVYANVTAQRHGGAESIKRLLVDQIVKPVRWEQTMQRLLADDGGANARWVELAPGRVLAGLLKRINRRLPVDSLSTADTLGGSKA
jgi:[acyl-carrier-protein] S-malonyltransferase